MAKSDNHFPTDVQLAYVPYTLSKPEITSAGEPKTIDLSKEFPGHKVVITSAIGAFTPPCTENHIPTYLDNVAKFKAKGVNRIIVLTVNDPFVNSAWAKALGYKDDDNYVIFATDPDATLSKELGENYVADMSKLGLGLRSNRYAAIVDDGTIHYLKSEDAGAFTDISNANTLLRYL